MIVTGIHRWLHHPYPTRERYRYSKPDSIANPADPRPGQPSPSRRRQNHSTVINPVMADRIHH